MTFNDLEGHYKNLYCQLS